MGERGRISSGNQCRLRRLRFRHPRGSRSLRGAPRGLPQRDRRCCSRGVRRLCPTSGLVRHRSYVAGFPCQPFSSLGLQEGANDLKGRGKIMYRIRDYLQNALPPLFVLENVRGFKAVNGGKDFISFIASLERIRSRSRPGESAYAVNVLELNSRGHGALSPGDASTWSAF